MDGNLATYSNGGTYISVAAPGGDFRFDDTRPCLDGLYLLEINTQPGMTPLSLVPEQAAYRGISFPDLVGWMVENAQCDA